MSKEAMKLALDALIAATPVKAKDPYMQAAALVALEEALAKLAEQPAQRKPLTEFEFEVLHRKAKGFVQTGLMDVVRLVENHHNIKENQS